MKHLTLLTAAASMLALSAAPLVNASTVKTECQQLFENADENNDGALTSEEANPLTKAVSAPSVLTQITEQEFLAECGAQVLQKRPANELAMLFLLVSASAGATSLLSPE